MIQHPISTNYRLFMHLQLALLMYVKGALKGKHYMHVQRATVLSDILLRCTAASFVLKVQSYGLYFSFTFVQLEASFDKHTTR